VIPSTLAAESRALKRSDVVFMYEADRQTYLDYGATVLAWGGIPTPQSREAGAGVRLYGSVGLVTEFDQYYERFPKTYEQGLCRDIDGRPVKVPWLTDHRHKGIPYWWCCTSQPLFRQYLSERVIETVRAGADGVHIDDHMGTAGGLWLGICFCDRCVDGFRDYLRMLGEGELRRLGIERVGEFNYRDEVKRWLAIGDARTPRQVTQHPLWPQWTIYQCRAAAKWMQELRELAARTAGRTVPFGANAGLLWPRHLSDYQTLDLFSAETDHHASDQVLSDLPLVAYRMADAVQRPYAATASGGDWAFVKEKNLPGLVRGWIALSYAAGQCFMAPHRQWCYTPEKGTHWYDGPKEKFVPLYQFVRRNADLFDEYEAYTDVGVVLPYRAFTRDPQRWFDICSQLAARNISYQLLLGGDEIVDHPLSARGLYACRAVLIPDREDLLVADRQLVEQRAAKGALFGTVTEALARLTPAVRIEAQGQVRALPRVKPGSAVIHLVNYRYDPASDDVRSLTGVRVQVDLSALGVKGARTCRWVTPDADPVELPISSDTVLVPTLNLWGLLEMSGVRSSEFGFQGSRVALYDVGNRIPKTWHQDPAEALR
jgi:hypothetical protein